MHPAVTPWRVLVGCSSPLFRPWVPMWINHWSLWRMVSATPNLRLSSQSQVIAASQLVPNYTAWWQRRMCVNNLPKVATWQRNGRELSSRPLESQANALNITSPSHTHRANRFTNGRPKTVSEVKSLKTRKWKMWSWRMRDQKWKKCTGRKCGLGHSGTKHKTAK